MGLLISNKVNWSINHANGEPSGHRKAVGENTPQKQA